MKKAMIVLSVAALAMANAVSINLAAQESAAPPTAAKSSPEGDNHNDQPYETRYLPDIPATSETDRATDSQTSPASDQAPDDFFSRESRIPVFDPLEAEGRDRGLDPPSDHDVILALERARPVEGGAPIVYEVKRTNMRIVKDKIVDSIDPPRMVFGIGPANLHHLHYKVTIHFDEETRVFWPIEHISRKDDLHEVIYMDKNHFHKISHTGAVKGKLRAD